MNDLYEIVVKLNGPSCAIGDHMEDLRRHDRLRELVQLFHMILDDLVYEARNSDSHMESVKTSGAIAENALKSAMGDLIEKYNVTAFDDTSRLDALQEKLGQYTGKVICRWSEVGRGLRLHETDQKGAVPSIREAIDNFLEEEEE